MRTIKRSSQFKKDYKRIKSTPRYQHQLEKLLRDVLKHLVQDEPLPERYLDHPLTGNWRGYRDCHLKPDLLLLYRKSEPNTLNLARLGSHSELFS